MRARHTAQKHAQVARRPCSSAPPTPATQQTHAFKKIKHVDASLASQFRALNSWMRSEKAMISVGHTKLHWGDGAS